MNGWNLSELRDPLKHLKITVSFPEIEQKAVVLRNGTFESRKTVRNLPVVYCHAFLLVVLNPKTCQTVKNL